MREAPSCHRYELSEIGGLTEIMGTKMIVHGHHHEKYQSTLANGMRVVGMATSVYTL